MPKYAPNRLPLSVPKRYFELRRAGLKGAAAARQVGVSVSCGSVWFIKAGSMLLPDKPIDARYLTQEDRIAIADGVHAGRSAAAISDELGKHRSTIYRELQRGRNPDGSYNPWWAHNQAILRRRRPKEEKFRASTTLREFVNDKLHQHWSPQQISRQLARRHPGHPVLNACPETIYRALYNGLLDKRTAKLRTARTRRRKQRRGIPLTNAIPRMRLIHTRPREADERTTAGHWEGDLIIGKGYASAIGTLVDRATRYVHLIHLPDGWKAPQVRDALAEQTAHLPAALRRTLTWDQGRELYLHEEIEDLTGFRIYFCDPHSPWQRGTNENTNGLLREYFPKGTNLTQYTARDLAQVARQLNERSRHVLGDRTPADAMQDWSTALAYD
ncbi:IS30 family transposase [Streptomyces sasae]|uniref:IS30 family transposase n=1 Tax=Streptomyces sasae TaxID=1266772 RepID=UPI00292D5181|nr:IS30 family transposase [Streptomyces sasae]